MSVFSLEDDECNGLFITQSDKIINNSYDSSENSILDLMSESDVGAEGSQNSLVQAIYLDICDVDFDIPSSQMVSKDEN